MSPNDFIDARERISHYLQPTPLIKSDILQQIFGYKSPIQCLEMKGGIGTHMDAPCHCIKGGISIADIALKQLVLPLIVISFNRKAAEVLLDRDISGIAIDTLSPDIGVDGYFPVHELFLGAGKYLIENVVNAHLLPQ